MIGHVFLRGCRQLFMGPGRLAEAELVRLLVRKSQISYQYHALALRIRMLVQSRLGRTPFRKQHYAEFRLSRQV